MRESELEVNGIGVLIADLPSDPAATREITVRNNLVIDGGLLEQAAPPGSPWQYLPRGVGVLILAADDVELAGNAIEGNRAAGVLLPKSPRRSSASRSPELQGERGDAPLRPRARPDHATRRGRGPRHPAPP